MTTQTIQGIIKAKTKEIKKTKVGYGFGIMINDKWYNFLETNLKEAQSYFDDLNKEDNIEIKYRESNNYNIVLDYTKLTFHNAIEEKVINEMPKIETYDEKMERLKLEKRDKIFLGQCLNLATQICIDKKIYGMSSIFDLANALYEEGLKRGYGK